MMKRRWLFHDRLGRRGIAAVEFALIFPVLLPLFIGTIEILTLYRAEGKLNALASNVARMVSAEAPVVVMSTGTPETGSSLSDICQGAIAGLRPFPPAGLTIDIASVTEESGPNGQPATTSANSASPTYNEWEADSTPGTCTFSADGSGIQTATGSSPQTLAAGLLQVPCDNAIIVTAKLNYPGITGLFINSAPTLTQTAYARWRYTYPPTSELTCPSCGAAPPPVCNSTNTATN